MTAEIDPTNGSRTVVTRGRAGRLVSALLTVRLHGARGVEILRDPRRPSYLDVTSTSSIRCDWRFTRTPLTSPTNKRDEDRADSEIGCLADSCLPRLHSSRKA